MLRKILEELIAIKEELRIIRKNTEQKQGKGANSKMSKAEVFYRSLTNHERQLIDWVLSLEKDSEALNTIKKLSLCRNSDNET